MSVSTPSIRLLAGPKQVLRQCPVERQQWRRYASSYVQYPSLQPKYPPPSPGFRPSQAIKQNRFETGLAKIPVVPPPRSTVKACPDPISVVNQAQIQVLDPTGARTRLFSPKNPERVQPGDILLVRQRNGEPFSGVVLVIRQRHSPIDWAVLLRNHLTRVGVEMWFKIYSPNVEGIEVVQRKTETGRRARRAKLYYMRQPRHDVGSVENVVNNYLRQKAGNLGNKRTTGGRDAGARLKSKKKSK